MIESYGQDKPHSLIKKAQVNHVESLPCVWIFGS